MTEAITELQRRGSSKKKHSLRTAALAAGEAAAHGAATVCNAALEARQAGDHHYGGNEQEEEGVEPMYCFETGEERRGEEGCCWWGRMKAAVRAVGGCGGRGQLRGASAEA